MKKRSLIYTIIVIALFEKVIFWLGVFTAHDAAAQISGIWKITFIFTIAAGYLAYWVFSQKDAALTQPEQPRPQARPLPRPGLTPVIIHPVQRSSGD